MLFQLLGRADVEPVVGGHTAPVPVGIEEVIIVDGCRTGEAIVQSILAAGKGNRVA